MPDALHDPRFSANPLVLGEPHIRSYAGVPLQSPDGYNVGALCAIDVVPRTFSDAQLAILRSFATLVVEQIGALILFASPTWGLYIVAIGMLSSFVFMVTGAWLLLVGVESTQAPQETNA